MPKFLVSTFTSSQFLSDVVYLISDGVLCGLENSFTNERNMNTNTAKAITNELSVKIVVKVVFRTLRLISLQIRIYQIVNPPLFWLYTSTPHAYTRCTHSNHHNIDLPP